MLDSFPYRLVLMSNADNLFEVEDNGTFKAVIIRMKTFTDKVTSNTLANLHFNLLLYNGMNRNDH
jgi:hypothetical protein